MRIKINPTVEGDATSLYLAKAIKPLGIMVTRSGDTGRGEIEPVDGKTMSKCCSHSVRALRILTNGEVNFRIVERVL